MLKLSIADIKRLALISKVSQDEVDSVEGIALVYLEALAKPILESDDPESIDAYNKLKAFIEQQKKEAITNPVLEGFDYGVSPLVSGDIPERYRKESSLLSSPYDSGFYVGMNTDLNEDVGWETYIDNMTELPTSKAEITEQDKIEFGRGFNEGRRSKGYGGEKVSIKKGAVENLPHIWEVTNEEFDELLTDPSSDPAIFERSERYFQEGGERFDTTEQWESWREKEFPGLVEKTEQYKNIIQFYKNEVADLLGKDPEWIDTGSLKFYREEVIYTATRKGYNVPDRVLSEYPALQHALTYSEEFIEQMKEVMKKFYYEEPDFPIGELNIGDYLIVKEYQPVLSKVVHKTPAFTTVEYIYNLKASYIEGKKRIKNKNKQGQDYSVFTISDDVLEYLLGAVLKKEGESINSNAGLTINDIKRYDWIEIEFPEFEGELRGPWLVQVVRINHQDNYIEYEFYGREEDIAVADINEINIIRIVEDPEE